MYVCNKYTWACAYICTTQANTLDYNAFEIAMSCKLALVIRT